ncbi:MAG: asparagine synthase (glutamine-hydrolyzing) [Candidatus Portnoybacteria bacterium]|nr:asparagine synthase (glutamine-hydrolyzing) [Candidatus Portnoybacteria bacterium]MDD4982497.1 asparagine synthase (glutamine-hydrolyzing) [Candidatus Portnoybacteria bacterium]
MCGINGFSFKDERLIGRMNAAIKHRGPDQDGIFLDDNFSLGHARLAVIDLSERGRQPIFNEDKTLAIVFNGEIYNFKELRRALEQKGHKFFSNTDTEVVLHLFEERRERCVEELDGIFAFAIYNLKERSLFAVRDHLGVKPLYYFWDEQKLIFSSEIKAILEHDIKREINQRALSSCWHMLYPLAPLTIFRKIFKLPPGHFLTLKKGQLDIRRYWRPKFEKTALSRNEIKNEIRRLAEEAVKKQLVSDRPLGVFLSGGIDSTVVAALAQKFSAAKLKTFCVGFDVVEEREKYNIDFEMARRVAKDLGTEHRELMIGAKDVLGALEKVAWHMDEPMSNHTQSITYLLSGFAKREVAVALGGDGGDEIFAGYPRYRLNLLLDQYQKIPVFLRRAFLDKAVSYWNKKGDLGKKLATPQGVERYLLYLSQKDKLLARAIKPSYFKDDWYKKKLEESYSDSASSDSNDLLMLMDLENWLPEESLMRTDKTTMAHGLEERVPLLDRSLVEFALKIPIGHKLGLFDSKTIFKAALGDLLPDYVAKAPKRGWFSPMAKWLRGDLKDFAFDVLSPNYCSGSEEFVDFPAARRILEDHISKKEYNLTLIWSLMSFQMWYKNYLSR